jgi:hypothetical protein
MKKWLKRILLTLLVIVSLYGVGRLIDVSYGSFKFVERQPYLQMQTQNSILIKWQSDKKEIGCVEYAEDKKVCEKEPTSYHKIKIENLKPSTKYSYKVISDSMDIDNTDRHFTTLYDKTIPMQRVWVIGDSGKAGEDQQNVTASMLHVKGNKELNMWLLLGDNAYKSGTQDQFNTSLFEPYAALVKYLVPWAVDGNHDARRWAFYDIFDYPTKGECGGVPSGSEKFFAIDDANIHLVMLDSHEGDMSKDSKMIKWLEKDLSQVSKPWIIVALHHPPYSDGSHKSDSVRDSWGRMVDARENIVPVLEKYGVDLVLSGHAHGYERSKLMHRHYGTSDTFDTKKHLLSNSDHNYCKSINKSPFDGTIYNVMGSSSKADRASYKHPALPFSYQSLGSVLLEITPTTLHAKFINDKAEILDEYTIEKKLTCKDSD